MTENYYKSAITASGDVFANRIKNRIRLLVLFSTLTVALAFGFSFYFGLISGASAITKQFPELEPIANKLKSLLMLNTFGFSAILMGSFYILTQLITARMFSPIARVQKKIQEITETTLPENDLEIETGPFEEMELSCSRLITALRSRDEKEIAQLKKFIEIIPPAAGIGQLKSGIEEMILNREIRLAKTHKPIKTKQPEATDKDGSLFMQPS